MTIMSRRDFIPKTFGLAAMILAIHRKALSLSELWLRSSPKLSRMLASLQTPIFMTGDATTAYRDPAAIYHNGLFYLYFTLVKIEAGVPYSYVAWSKSSNLGNWTSPKLITEKSTSLDFGSPGDIVRVDNEWVLCLQTYPRPLGERYGNGDSRIWTMRSQDLEQWRSPELLRVKGPNVPDNEMGRMIDPYLIKDKNHPGTWLCFYKQDGIRLSRSTDFRTWTPVGKVSGGENPCILIDGNEYILFYSPQNGIGVKRSADLKTWSYEGLLTLGQNEWPWAAGRLTAGFVVDLRHMPEVGRALMFFHGSRYPEDDIRGGFDNFASLGIAWSSNLRDWNWPGKHAVVATGRSSRSADSAA